MSFLILKFGTRWWRVANSSRLRQYQAEWGPSHGMTFSEKEINLLPASKLEWSSPQSSHYTDYAILTQDTSQI